MSWHKRKARLSRSPSPHLTALLVVAWAAVGLTVPAARGQNETEAELEAVREQLEALEARMDRQSSRRDAGIAELRRLELAVADGERELESTTRQAADQRARLQSLEQSERQAGVKLDSEQGALAEQVRLSFMTGRQEIFKLLLSQERPADLGRMLVYYDYMNRARSGRIESVGVELAALAASRAETQAAKDELERLRLARQRELDALNASRQQRQTLVAELEAAIAAAGSEMEQLQAEEDRLAQLVKEIAELLAEFPIDSEAAFSELRGELAWPVDGNLSVRFGELRAGGPLRWNGVMLQAEAGAVVRAVYHGRVAFADWLPGLGLLLIVDHGEGFMSLYGHNEALLREPGDWVSPGEPIARVGDTGGRATPSLYFEIRQNGEPVDPERWVP